MVDRPGVDEGDLAGAKRVDLVVDYGEAGDVLDQADWLEARLVE